MYVQQPSPHLLLSPRPAAGPRGLHLSFLIYKKRCGDDRYGGPPPILLFVGFLMVEAGGWGRPGEAARAPAVCPSCREGAASSTASSTVPRLHGVPGKAAEADGRAREDMRSLTIQPGKARNRQKVKIPFVNKIELFDCETRVRGISNNLI